MSAAKKLLAVLAVSAFMVALHSAPAAAQGSPSNPSGGTSLRQTRVEGGAVLPNDYLSRGISADAGLWFNTFVAARYSFAAAARPVVGRTLWAVTQRKIWGR